MPLHRPTGSSAEDSPVKTVTQFEMSVLESLGLLKVDFLGLATLTIMARACDLIRKRHGIELQPGQYPHRRPGDLRAAGARRDGGRVPGGRLGHAPLADADEAQRAGERDRHGGALPPGPMDFIPGYIRRMHGEEAVDYRHPCSGADLQGDLRLPGLPGTADVCGHAAGGLHRLRSRRPAQSDLQEAEGETAQAPPEIHRRGG